MVNLSQKLKKSVIIIISGILFFSCGDPSLYDRYQAMDNSVWEKNKEYFFSFEITDISTPYNLTLEVRNNNLYPYKNLWIISTQDQPIGPLQRDTTECILADEYGKWKGNGISLFQSSFSIKKNYIFPHTGLYTFSFKQMMRDESLKGIQEIGFRVTQVNKKTTN